MIRIKRIYEAAAKEDGTRILVDRLWPRGLKKQDAKVDLWLKEIGPSDELRKWFSHDPDKWEEFKKRFSAELDKKRDLVQVVVDKAKEGDVTILFGSKEERFNNAHALADYLKRKKKIQFTAGRE